MSLKEPALGTKWDVGSSVLSLSVSHDGKYVTTGSHDGHVRVWDMHTEAMVIGPLKGHVGWVWSVAFSPDDAHIVSGSDDCKLRIWDTHTGNLIGNPLQGHTGSIRSVAFSPNDSRIVSGSYDHTICVWNVRTSTLMTQLIRGHTNSVCSVAFSPDGSLIISGSEDRTIGVWNALSGSLLSKFQGHSSGVRSVAPSPDNSLIVSGSSDCTVRMWDLRTGTAIGEPLKGHALTVNSVAFSPNGAHIISGSDDRTICIWDARTRAPVGEPLQRHTGSVQSVTFSPDNTRIISGSLDSTVSVWEALKQAHRIPQGSPSFDKVSRRMTKQEMFNCLVKHKCPDHSARISATYPSTLITSGGFGSVWHTELTDGTPVAIKTLKLLSEGNNKDTVRAAQEMYIWSRLQHRNVQAFLGVALFKNELGMVSPWMEKGNLIQYIKSNPKVERYQLCAQLASGVSYLHSVGMVHGDLKALNVLVSDDGTLKINDFDHAILSNCTLRFSTNNTTGGGTTRWMAPELFLPEGADEGEGEGEGESESEGEGEGEGSREGRGGTAQSAAVRSQRTDVYALGMTMLEIFTGKPPYSEYKEDQGIQRAFLLKQPPKCPKVLKGPNVREARMWGLLLRCWDHDPSARPKASAVYTSIFNLIGSISEPSQNLPSFDMVSSKMSGQELFQCLVKHGCTDLTAFLRHDEQSSWVIASGGFGDVRRLTLKNGMYVAVKTLRLHVLLHDDKGVKRAVREVYLWSKLRHPNVQELLGIVIFQGGLGMVSPWMKRGNLAEYINSNPEVERYQLCVQLASGVSYLHSVGMVHGDLKAVNVLVSDDGTLKISDFDYAILSSDATLRFSATTKVGGGTLRWMAPELLMPEDEDEDGAEALQPVVVRSKLTDLYALGMTMLEIFTGKPPYSEYQSEMGIVRALYRKQTPTRPKVLKGPNVREARMWELLLQCWDHDPSARPDASSVLASLNSFACSMVSERK